MKKVVIIILIISVMFMTGCSVKKTKEVTDNEKFAMEYSVEEDNPFKYINTDEVVKKLSSSSSVIYFASSEDEWCQITTQLLIDVVKDTDIKTIYYYDPTQIKYENTEDYKEIVKLLDEYLEDDEITLPSLFVIEDKKIISYDIDLGKDTFSSNEYLSKKNKKTLKNRYLSVLNGKKA